MYSLNDKKSAILEVQRFLFVIGQENDVSHLSVDGFYTEETQRAVRDFQALHSLEVTGNVDRETFDMIYSEYCDTVSAKSSYASASPASIYPMKIGDSGNEVSELNLLIRRLSRFYKELPITEGNFYSKSTEKAVRLLQRYMRRAENGKITPEFFSALKKELLNRQKFENA